MNMTAEVPELTERIDTHSRDVAILSALWRNMMTAGSAQVECPPDSQFQVWRDLHPFEVVAFGLRETAEKWQRLGCVMSLDHAVRFASKCMNCRSVAARTTWLRRSAARAGVL